MTTTSPKGKAAATVQDVCIDLPGETVKCWRSTDNVKVILRKHRDIIFDINLQKGAVYTVESTADFYSPLRKKLLKKIDFFDGDRTQIWVGREFKAKLMLKMNGRTIWAYEVNRLDTSTYGADPKIKPEPLMVIMGKQDSSVPFTCTPDDPFGVASAHSQVMPAYESKFSILKDLGTKFDYTHLYQPAEVCEYCAVTEASSHEIQPQVLAQLDRGTAVQGNVDQIFLPPKKEEPSLLYKALFIAAGNISGNSFLTGNFFKEAAGYIVQNFKELNKVSMMVHIEKKAKGAYKVALKGYYVPQYVGDLLGLVKKGKPKHVTVPLGSIGSEFIDGGFAKTGRAGYGGFKRIMTTSAGNFVKGMKIQGVGTVIDLIVDVNAVYFDEKGSRDLSEFLGRAGVSIAKAGVTAALGSAFAAIGTAILTGMFAAGAVPVLLVVAVIVGGFVGAAMLVDAVDDSLNIKERTADWAK
jgi:hypothetical protein